MLAAILGGRLQHRQDLLWAGLCLGASVTDPPQRDWRCPAANEPDEAALSFSCAFPL